MLVAPGDTLDRRYRVVSLLGRGGMGEVWAGSDLLEGEPVAIKVIAGLRDERALARFEREGEVLKRLQSPRICALRAVGLAGDVPYLVFEHIEGEPLSAVIDRERVLDVSRTVAVIAPILEGLATAHASGVIHRDVKPENVIVSGSLHAPGVKLIDFGIAKMLGGARTLTSEGTTLGSLACAAPEQLEAASTVDVRADLYAVATIGYRLLTGRFPFGGRTSAAIAALKLREEPATLRHATGRDWPEALEGFFACGLARDRERRFANAEAMHAALDAAVR